MKVLVDANVLISAIVLQPSRVTPLVEYLLLNHEFCITSQIATELSRNTLRMKPHMSEVIQEFLNRNELFWIETITNSDKVVHRNTTDQPILDAAIDNEIDIIVTGDKGFHALEIGRPCCIMLPRDFIDEFFPD